MESGVRKFFPWFTVLGLILGGLVMAAYYKDQFRDWKYWQSQYRKQELARATNDDQRQMALRLPIEIKQLVLPELGRVDRCMTCHIAVEDPSYAGFPQPLAYHPNHDQHPFEMFGCTICHQGQGSATTREAAHGKVPHWDRPMLPMKYIQSSCAKCHLPENVPNAPKLVRGQAVFEEVGCIGCHKLLGRGGVIGPELDKAGANHSPEWLIKHFKSPASVSPGSAMPPIHVSDEDLDALTLYVLSFTGEDLSAYYVSMKTIPGVQAGERLFAEKGCIGCHSVGGKGGNVGPALDQVAARRGPDWIMQHFRNPQSVSPGSVMPQFDLSEQQIRALTEFLLSLSDPNVVGFLKIPSQLTPVERGKAVFKKYGCAGCHGKDGGGGVPNPNSKTGQQVPKLIYVAESYTKDEAKKRILNGQHEIYSLDPSKPAPPLFMPAWRGKIAEGELNDLIEYLFSLEPKEEKLNF
ncbi:MAG TPA: c-type cytochrome [Acidobacteriota bacterium]|nr:c-type cytochrome [Acidobacteriota bacterium]